jgi:hypothetical protein
MALTKIGFTGTVDSLGYAQSSLYQGAAFPVAGGKGDMAVTPGTSLTANVAAGRMWAPGVLLTNPATEVVSFDAVTTPGATRWDAVVIRMDWSGSGSAVITVVKGTAGAAAPQVLPSGVDQTLDATFDVVLALVQLTYGSTLPVVVPRRLWGHKTFTAETLSALPPPSAALYGMHAWLVTGEEYRCLSDATNSPAWIRQGGWTIGPSSFLSSASGWTTSGLVNRYMTSGDGRTTQYDLNFQRTGASLQFTSTSGAITDNLVATLNGPRPDRGGSSLPVTFRHYGGQGPTSTGRLTCWGYLQGDGELYIESGIPSAYLNSAGGAWALTCTIQFTRGS